MMAPGDTVVPPECPDLPTRHTPSPGSSKDSSNSSRREAQVGRPPEARPLGLGAAPSPAGTRGLPAGCPPPRRAAAAQPSLTPRRCPEEAAGGQDGARSRLRITALRFLLEQNDYSPRRGPEFSERHAGRQLRPSPKAGERFRSESQGAGRPGRGAEQSARTRRSPGPGRGALAPV